MAAMQAPKGAQCIPRLIGFGPKILAPSWPADPNGILHEHIVVSRAPSKYLKSRLELAGLPRVASESAPEPFLVGFNSPMLTRAVLE